MKFFKDFKEFAMKGNVIDLATGVIIGAAFGKIVSSMVNDVIMPLITLITGEVDFTKLFISLNGVRYENLEAAKAVDAATLNYGNFITSIVDFLIIAVVIFIMIKQIGKIKRKPAIANATKVEKEVTPEKTEPTTKECIFCKSEINIKATRCPLCTSQLSE